MSRDLAKAGRVFCHESAIGGEVTRYGGRGGPCNTRCAAAKTVSRFLFTAHYRTKRRAREAVIAGVGGGHDRVLDREPCTISAAGETAVKEASFCASRAR